MVAHVHPEQGGYIKIFVVTTTNIFRIMFTYLTLQLIVRNNYNLTSVAYAVESLSSWSQGFFKILPLILYNDNIMYLITSIKYCWYWDETEKNIAKLFKYGYKTLVVYKYGFLMALSFYLLANLNANRVIFSCWIPYSSPKWFWTIFWLQTYTIYIDFCYIIGIDMLFVATSIIIISQFHLLNQQLAMLGILEPNNVRPILIKCINHHQFLFRYCKVFIKTFSLLLMGEYMITASVVCVQLYALSERTTLIEYVACLVYIIGMIFQLGVYCFFAEEVTDIGLNTATSIFNSNWYTLPQDIQMNIKTIIRRSQRPIVFSAGNMAQINRKAYTVIFKGALSFYTSMRQMKEKRERELM